MTNRDRWPASLIFHFIGAALLAGALLALTVLLIFAMPARGQSYPQTVEIRWKHEAPSTVERWLIFLGTGPDCPLVDQQPAVVLSEADYPPMSGPRLYTHHLLIQEQTCAVIGAANAEGMTIDPTVWAYPIPWRGDCAWWAARDSFPSVLGIPDCTSQGLSAADRLYCWSMMQSKVAQSGGFRCP